MHSNIEKSSVHGVRRDFEGEAITKILTVESSGIAVGFAVAVAVEKVFQGGGDMIRKKGVRVKALARIATMSDDVVSFSQ